MPITLIAIHGNGGGGFRFERIRPHLPDDITLVAPTLPGFDGVPPLAAGSTLTALANHLRQEIEALPRPRILLGHGIGGSIALELLQQSPDTVDGLILHAPVGAALEHRRFPRLMKRPIAQRIGQWAFTNEWLRPLWTHFLFSRPIPPDIRDRFFEAYGRSAAFGQMFDGITADWFQGLKPIALPTALLWGGKERVLGVEHLHAFRALAPNALVKVLPDWDHFPMLEQPAAYATEVAALARHLTGQSDSALAEGLVWLGGGAAASRGVGNKGSLLDAAKAKGLPVPDGLILRHEAFLAAQAGTLIRQENGKWIAPDPAALLAYLGLPRWHKAVAVRSAFSAEDRASASLAGYFASRLNVKSDDPAAFAAALCAVWDSAGDDDTLRRDVLILEMVKAVRAGVAFTEADYEDDVANIARGTAEKLVAGEEKGERLEIPKLREWEQELAHLKLKAGPARLQRLLRDVRTTFGDKGWDIEWADDGTRCYLIQLRPITRPLRRNESFTLANHKEILPDLPSRFMGTLISSCADGLFGWYRQFDSTLPATRPFIELFYGRPLINLSLLEEMMRRWGLPTSLVTTNIGGGNANETKIVPSRMVRHLPIFLRLGWAQLFALPTTAKSIRYFKTLALPTNGTFSQNIATLQTLYVELVNGMFTLTTAMSVPLALLRRIGTLEAHQAAHETIATALYHELNELRSFVTDEMRPILAAGELPSDPTFRQAWASFLAKYGHRGIYESDIARPRYYEAPDPLLMALSTPPAPVAHRSATSVWATEPLWQWTSALIRQREQLRYAAMRAFDQVRQRLLTLAGQAVAKGQLPTVEHLWQLTVTEAEQLDSGWRADPSFWKEREAEIVTLAELRLPDTLKRFDGQPGEQDALPASHQLTG